LPPVTAPNGAGTLTQQVEQLRLRDRRFRDIRFEIRDGRVTLQGTVGRAQDAWEFAQLVRRLPGVTGVTNKID
jgi:osmotically-inducible protein OsmY